MTRRRWRLAAVAAAVLVPLALVGVLPATGHADGDNLNKQGEVVLVLNGTICQETPPPEPPAEPSRSPANPSRSAANPPGSAAKPASLPAVALPSTSPVPSRSPVPDPSRPPKESPYAVTITLSRMLDAPATVVFATRDGTAQAPGDYVAVKPTTIVIPAKTLVVRVPVQVNADLIKEPDEYFVVTISKPSVGRIAKGGDTAYVIIQDGAGPTPIG